MKADDRYTDEWGRCIYPDANIFELLYQGHVLDDVIVNDGSLVREHNHWCKVFDHLELSLSVAGNLTESPATFHAIRQRRWLMDSSYAECDMREWLLARCTTDIERARIAHEMSLFEGRGLVPMLRFLCFMVDRLRENSMWWGVGRGSSTSSFVLYLIGVHKINPLRYGLDIAEFLHD